MEKFKEFQGKDLDEAIERACDFFDCAREKMEIEILQDAKSGIFGIVGARKAKIRARRIHLQEAVQSVLGAAPPAARKGKQSAAEKKHSRQTDENADQNSEVEADNSARSAATSVAKIEDMPDREPAIAPKMAASCQDVANNETTKPGKHSKGVSGGQHQYKKKPSLTKTEAACENNGEIHNMEAEAQDYGEDSYELRPLEELDRELLEKKVVEVVSRLIKPIAGKDVPVKMELGHGRIRVGIEWEGDAGLLIGRDGMTLVAVQYLASRMVSHAMNADLRIQLDIGDYHKRQDDRLRETAHILADKARKTGKSWSTRPLSSYHRRIIHLSLRNEADVQTRSSGEGPLKRVIIFPKRFFDNHGE